MTQADGTATNLSAVRLLSREEAEREDRLFWHSKTPAERLAAAEQLRQIAYGYDAATARIQEVVVRPFLKKRSKRKRRTNGSTTSSKIARLTRAPKLFARLRKSWIGATRDPKRFAHAPPPRRAC